MLIVLSCFLAKTDSQRNQLPSFLLVKDVVNRPANLFPSPVVLPGLSRRRLFHFLFGM